MGQVPAKAEGDAPEHAGCYPSVAVQVMIVCTFNRLDSTYCWIQNVVIQPTEISVFMSLSFVLDCSFHCSRERVGHNQKQGELERLCLSF